MIGLITVAAVVVGFFFSAFFSGAETGLYSLNRIRLHLGVQSRDARALRIASVLEDEQQALSVTLIGTNVAEYLYTTAVAFLFAELLRFSDADTQLYTVLLVTPASFVLCSVVPKDLFRIYADDLMLRGSAILLGMNRLFRATGVTWLLRAIVGATNRLVGVPDDRVRVVTPKRRIAAMLQEAIAGHTQAEDRSDLIERVCQISEIPVRAVMVPQHRVTMISHGANRAELVRISKATPFARLAVYSTKRSDVVGVVKIDELIRSDDWHTVGEMSKPVITLRPYETVSMAIQRMQEARFEMAMVTDHGGQLLGIVTLRDLLEEIVGEWGGEQ